MKQKNYLNVYLFLLVLLVLPACNYTKHLPAGDTLFVGGKVNIKDKEASKKTRKSLKSDMEGAVRPKPNSKFLGIPYKLDIYNLAGTPKKKKGLRAWLRKIGEPPVLTTSVNLEFNRQIMVNLLQNKGFFFPTVAAKEVTDKKRRTKAVFDVTTGPQYHIKQEMYVPDSSQISKDIMDEQDNTLLTPGQPYNLDLIKGERDRIFRALQQEGYYYFSSNYLIAEVDSSVGDHQVNIYMHLKTDAPDNAYNVYKINKVYIFDNYRLNSAKNDTSRADAVFFRGYYIVDPKKKYRPVLFGENMMFATGDLYNLDDQNITLSRLVNLGTFKYVKNRFDPVDDSLLDAYYYLNSFPKKSIQFQIGVLTQDDNREGSQASISFKNRNTFRGAELFTFKIDGGFEAQYGGGVQHRPNIYNLGAESDLSFPRFVVPFFYIPSYSAYTPKSIIRLRYNYESQSDLLRINQYTASYGFDWKESANKEHQLYPFNFTYVKTDTLGNAANLNLLYGNLIFNGIILGPTYEFTYHSQQGITKRNAYYFDGLIDFSGNILGLAQHANYNTNPELLFGSTYAQYMKYQIDFRYYHNINKTTSWASRILAGLGIPYGNSFQLPNVKQFWAGGNSDMRGFPSRLLGPGTFNQLYRDGTSQYLETLGDIKLEGNTEYRFNIYKFLNAAFFIDAGNIWNYRENPDFPGGKFTSAFLSQLAVDGGFGLRFDFKILILRLDLGIPLRDPWLPEDDRWVLNKVDFGDKTWRKQNLILNIGIGYPF